MAVITSTDRPKSVRNLCVIELFGGMFVLSLCPFDISVRTRAFCHRTELDLFFFPLRLLSMLLSINFLRVS